MGNTGVCFKTNTKNSRITPVFCGGNREWTVCAFPKAGINTAALKMSGVF